MSYPPWVVTYIFLLVVYTLSSYPLRLAHEPPWVVTYIFLLVVYTLSSYLLRLANEDKASPLV